MQNQYVGSDDDDGDRVGHSNTSEAQSGPTQFFQKLCIISKN